MSGGVQMKHCERQWEICSVFLVLRLNIYTVWFKLTHHLKKQCFPSVFFSFKPVVMWMWRLFVFFSYCDHSYVKNSLKVRLYIGDLPVGVSGTSHRFQGEWRLVCVRSWNMCPAKRKRRRGRRIDEEKVSLTDEDMRVKITAGHVAKKPRGGKHCGNPGRRKRNQIFFIIIRNLWIIIQKSCDDQNKWYRHVNG